MTSKPKECPFCGVVPELHPSCDCYYIVNHREDCWLYSSTISLIPNENHQRNSDAFKKWQSRHKGTNEG